jgi:hypothetical protein
MIDKEKILKHITSYKDFLEHFSISKYSVDLMNSIEKGKFDVKESSLWLTFKEGMPRLNQEVEVKFKDSEIKKLFLTLEEEPIYEICRLIFVSKDKSFTANLKQIESWRPIPEETERKPDFGRLNQGDFILFEYDVRHDNPKLKYSKISGFVKKGFLESNGYLTIATELQYCYFHDEVQYDKDKIIKITRINMETKEFEEI